MNQEAHELPDHHQYRLVWFPADSIKFFVSALGFFIEHAESEKVKIEQDQYLNDFLTEETRREFMVGGDLEYAKSLREFLEKSIEITKDHFGVTISPNHKEVRFLKSVGLLYLGAIKIRRNEIASRSNIGRNTLAAIDREITKKEEFLSSAGVFSNANPLPLFVEQQVALSAQGQTFEIEPQSFANALRPAPVVIDSIQILDAELRKRCLDLFGQFQNNGQPERNDTVVSEAMRILEDRLRTILRCDVGMTARQLSVMAFNPDKPRLRVSAIRAEQEAAQLLFQGAFGFIRNQVQHKLIDDLPAERVLQILGWIDYLLAVINQSEQIASESTD
jgi:hypothetical protein